MEIITRKQWGARAPKTGTRVPWADRTGVVIHHTTGSNLGRDDSAEWLRAIQAFHMDDRGWWDIGYNYAVDRNGKVYELRGWTRLGAHVAGHNTANIGLVLLGDGRRADNWTAAAREALHWLCREADRRAGRHLTVRGHGELAPTACPGDDVQRWIAAGLPLDQAPAQAPADGLVLPPKPVIRPTKARPAVGGRIARETRLAQAALTHYHGLGGVVGAIDGWPGPKFARAVRELQRARGARLVDGIPGPETWPMILSR